MKRFRRILSSVLALSLLLGMFSLNGSAMAQESAIDSQTLGTTKALEMGEVQGAMSGISIGVCGIITVILSLFL